MQIEGSGEKREISIRNEAISIFDKRWDFTEN